ncbi:phosphatase PAP2 family protein [Herminiimonas fonticola]|uniref:Undecaprenyl-diphosphatase n=2 Tax=Herminiimonas fonticola TaxID=303380 RepID=A0A4R6GH44_9BURK|nr:phosphatase PAP2 family protein [Herminiimonas fonticola]RBA25108.1 PAP2 superfamily [Herminiimonas fonticola]TDN94223.1 undecaprenyl-diphosphatase [Herminiimonas fonticola]
MKNLARAEFPHSLIHRRDVSHNFWREYGLRLFNARYVWGILASLGVFFLLVALTNVNRPWSFESSILLYLHAYATSSLDRLAVLISASVAVASVAILVYLIYRRSWRVTAFLLASTAGVEVITRIAKVFFHHSRPQLWDVISHQTSFAFPSGHATQSMALVLALIVIFYSRPHRLVQILAGALFIIVVAFSRMYLGLHFPTDILAGWALAMAWVCMLALIFKKAEPALGMGRAI